MRVQPWQRLLSRVIQSSVEPKSGSVLVMAPGVPLEASACPWYTCRRSYAAPALSRTGKPPANGTAEKSGANKVDRRVNRSITARNVRLVGNEGHEILTRQEALSRAHQEGLDLVEVDGKSDPPVCKLMDFSKERFKEKRYEKEMRKKQLERRRLDDMKEVRFSTRTEHKDLEMKANIVTRLLTRGHRVKLVVQSHANDKVENVGVELLERLMRLLPAIMKVENGPRVEKSRAWVLIRPVIEQVRVAKTVVEISSNDGQDLDEADSDDEAIVRTAEDQEKVEILHSN